MSELTRSKNECREGSSAEETAIEREALNELVRRARDGDDLAFAELVGHYRKLIYWRLNRLNIEPGGDIDDYEQEALIALMRAVRTYDESSGSSFTTYASSCIRNALVDAQRKESKRRSSSPVSWDAAADDLPSGETPESALIDRESSSLLYNRMISVLSGFEKNVFQCYLANMTHAEIAALLDRDERSIENAIFRIRRKLANLLTAST